MLQICSAIIKEVTKFEVLIGKPEFTKIIWALFVFLFIADVARRIFGYSATETAYEIRAVCRYMKQRKELGKLKDDPSNQMN